MRRYGCLINIIFAALLIIEIIYFRDALLGLFTLGSFGMLLEIALLLLSWYKWPYFKRVLGEGRTKNRSRFRTIFNLLSLIVVFLPTSLYILKSLIPGQLPASANISLIALSLSLAGLSFSAISDKIKVDDRIQLLCVAQKFILVVVLFIIFIPFIYLVDQPPFNGININSFVWPPDTISFTRGLLFWIATPCYYVGIILFWFGISDFLVTLANLNFISDKKQDTNLVIPQISQTSFSYAPIETKRRNANVTPKTRKYKKAKHTNKNITKPKTRREKKA